MNESVHGIEYSKPTVILLQETGIGTSEYAARTCYDSFDASENEWIKNLNKEICSGGPLEWSKPLLGFNHIDHSDLLDQLAWTHFHHSILEHANLTYLIKGTSRGVLQEHARHRIQAISVRSTRYTMSSIINAFVAHAYGDKPSTWFIDKVLEMDLFVTQGIYNRLEVEMIYNKLIHQRMQLGSDKFLEISVAKSSLPFIEESLDSDDLFKALEEGKKKRNVGDAFKHIVTDNWKVDMVVTMNLRALKNYLTLRDSGSAYFQIRWLAQTIKTVTPSKYLDLIIKQ